MLRHRLPQSHGQHCASSGAAHEEPAHHQPGAARDQVRLGIAAASRRHEGHRSAAWTCCRRCSRAGGVCALGWQPRTRAVALRRPCARHAQVGPCLEAVSAAGRPHRQRVPRSRRVQPEAGGVSVHRRLGGPPVPRSAAATMQQPHGRARQAGIRRALRRQLRRRARPLLLRGPQDALPAAPPTRLRACHHSGVKAARRPTSLPEARA